VELIALAMLENSPQVLYGAVTIGNVWIFGTLDTEAQLITQDVATYTLPDRLESLIKTLVGILE